LNPLAQSHSDAHYTPSDNLEPCDKIFAFKDPAPILAFAVEGALWHMIFGFDHADNNTSRKALRDHLTQSNEVPDDKPPWCCRAMRARNVPKKENKTKEEKAEAAAKKKLQRVDIEKIRVKIRHTVSNQFFPFPLEEDYTTETAALYPAPVDDDREVFNAPKLQECLNRCSVKTLLHDLAGYEKQDSPVAEVVASFKKKICKIHNLIKWYARNELTACVLNQVIQQKRATPFGGQGYVLENHEEQIKARHVWEGGDPDMFKTMSSVSWGAKDFALVTPEDRALAKQLGQSWTRHAQHEYQESQKPKKARKRAISAKSPEPPFVQILGRAAMSLPGSNPGGNTDPESDSKPDVSVKDEESTSSPPP
jgi:hypothetical protein